MNWEDEFIERFCDVHKPSNPWQPKAYKWTLFKTTETEDVFVFIESLLKKERQSIINKIREMIEEIKPKEKEVFYGSPEYYEWVACIGMLTNLIQ